MTPPGDGPGGNPGSYAPPGVDRSPGSSTTSTKVAAAPGHGETDWERPHDPRALVLPMLRGGRLSRGFIVQDKNDPAVAQNKHGKPLGLRFLYNPTTVQVGYSINTDIYPSNDAPGGAVPLIGVPGSASVSFDLILDRTYDVWQNPLSRGIREDVEQFQSMMAYNDDTPYIQPVGMFVIFGNPMLKFYGFIQSFSILYTNWTQTLVPYRGALSGITMQVLPSGKVRKVKAVSSPQNYTAAGGGPNDKKHGKKGGKGDGSGRGGKKDDGGGSGWASDWVGDGIW